MNPFSILKKTIFFFFWGISMFKFILLDPADSTWKPCITQCKHVHNVTRKHLTRCERYYDIACVVGTRRFHADRHSSTSAMAQWTVGNRKRVFKNAVRNSCRLSRKSLRQTFLTRRARISRKRSSTARVH